MWNIPEVEAFHDNRRGTKPGRDLIKQLGLLAETAIVQRRAFAFLRAKGDHPGRRTDQEDVGQAPHEAPVAGRDHVRRHLLLVEQALTLRDWPEASGSDAAVSGGSAPW